MFNDFMIGHQMFGSLEQFNKRFFKRFCLEFLYIDQMTVHYILFSGRIPNQKAQSNQWHFC